MMDRVILRRAPAHASASPLALLALASVAISGPSAAQETDASGAVVLPTLSVEDRSKATPLDRKTGLSVLSTTVQDTPQQVNIITGEMLREQGVTSLEQALRNVPGITVSIGEGGTLNGDQFMIRGFDAKDDVYVDGLKDFGAYTRDSFNYEEVQVLKGPSGALFGRGTTGGVVNTRSKTPRLDNQYSATGYVGNGDYYRGLVDLNHAVSDNAAVRLNVMGNATGVVDRDFIKSKRWGVAPSVAFGLNADTSFTLRYLHQHDRRVPDYGIVVAQRPGSLIAVPVTEFGVPRANFLQYDTDVDVTNADIVTARFTHNRNAWLTFTNDARYGSYDRYFQYTTVDRCDDTAATGFCSSKLFGANPQGAQGGIGGGGPYQQNSWGLQNIATARAKFSLGTLRNEMIVGFDVSHQNNKKAFWFYTLPSTSEFTYALGNGTAARTNIGRSLFNPVPTPPPGYAPFRATPATIASSTASATSVTDTRASATDLAGFLTNQLWLTDALSLVASLRYDDYTAKFNTVTVAGVVANLQATNHLTSPKTSLVFEPTETATYYFSWGRSQTPQGTNVVGSGTALAVTTQDLQPEIADTYELGAKVGVLPEGALTLTASLFQTTKNNATQRDPASGDTVLQSGQRQRIRGIELGAVGRPMPFWTVTANYTHLDSKILSDLSCSTTAPISCLPNRFTIGRQVINVPKNAFSLWNTLALAKVWEGLSVSAGLTYQDAMPVRYTNLGTAPLITGLSRIAMIPKSIAVDTTLSHQTGPYRFALNLYNLFDRLNYSQSFGNRGVPAAGRTVVFSAGVEF